jgi:hypothetical protein
MKLYDSAFGASGLIPSEDEKRVVIGARVSSEKAGGPQKDRFSITLSPSATKAFYELKIVTDADTDTEVFRNALRLHVALVRAHKEGKKLYLEDGKERALLPVNLFAPTE